MKRARWSKRLREGGEGVVMAKAVVVSVVEEKGAPALVFGLAGLG